MGRSKFPGKPPKTATRKRIKVLGQPEAAQNDPVTVAENIYYGLSLFNETFGDNEKVRGKKRVVAPRRPPFAVAIAVAIVVAVAVAVRRSPSAVARYRRRRRRRRCCRSARRGRARPTSVASRATHRVSPLAASRSRVPSGERHEDAHSVDPVGDADELWRGVTRGLTYAAMADRGGRSTAGARRLRGSHRCRSTIRFSL